MVKFPFTRGIDTCWKTTFQGSGEEKQTLSKWPLKSYLVLPLYDSISQRILQATPETLKSVDRSSDSETQPALPVEPRT